MATVLVLGPEQEAIIDGIIAHARKPEHYYDPDHDDQPPGDDPRHIGVFGLVRVAYWITKKDECPIHRNRSHLFHHVRVSNLLRHGPLTWPRDPRYPDPDAIKPLLYRFGLTLGDEMACGLDPDPAHPAIIFVEEYMSPFWN